MFLIEWFLLSSLANALSQTQMGEWTWQKTRRPLSEMIQTIEVSTKENFDGAKLLCDSRLMREIYFSSTNYLVAKALPPSFECELRLFVRRNGIWSLIKAVTPQSPFPRHLRLSVNNHYNQEIAVFWGLAQYESDVSSGFQFPALFNSTGELIWISPIRGRVYSDGAVFGVQSKGGVHQVRVSDTKPDSLEFEGMSSFEGRVFFQNTMIHQKPACLYLHWPYPKKVFGFPFLYRVLGGFIHPLSWRVDILQTSSAKLYSPSDDLWELIQQDSLMHEKEKIYSNEPFFSAIQKLGKRKPDGQCNVVLGDIVAVDESAEGDMTVVLRDKLIEVSKSGKSRVVQMDPSIFGKGFVSFLDARTFENHFYLLNARRKRGRIQVWIQEFQKSHNHMQLVRQWIVSEKLSLFPEGSFVSTQKDHGLWVSQGVGIDGTLRLTDVQKNTQPIDWNAGKSLLKIYDPTLFKIPLTSLVEFSYAN